MKKILPILMFALMSGIAFQAQAASPATGAWELCVDPDGDPKDVLRLEPDGTGKVVNADGRSYAFTYSVKGAAITLEIHANGQAIVIPLTISPDRKKLFKPNQEKGTQSTYVRLGNPDKFACTAK